MDERTDEQLIEVVERFILRARRILSHSLCEDEEALGCLADGAWYASRKDGVESIHRRLPNEEALESLAARVRPLMLQKDGVHYNAVLNALSSYLSRYDRPHDATWCKELKKDWKTVDLTGGTAGYFLSVTVDGSGEPPSEMTDVGLAGSWFYGDLVHADQEQIDAGKFFGIEHRFSAAAVRTAQIAILARELLTFVQVLADEGLMEVDDKVLSKVAVKVEPEDVELSGLYSAPVGTEVPGPAGTPLGEQWQTTLPGTDDGEWIMRIPWGGEG
jgi:hypothetical protein